MRWGNLLGLAAALCGLSACELESAQETADKNQAALCADPQIAAQYRDIVRERLAAVTAARVKTDFADLVDANTVTAGLADSTLTLENARHDSSAAVSPERVTCRAQLNIVLSHEVLEQARTYAPFIYSPNRYSAEVNNVANINLVSRTDNAFIQNITYSVLLHPPASGRSVVANDTELNRIAQTLSSALLPYGVKATVTLNGEAVPRDEALQQLFYLSAGDKTVNSGELPVNRLPETGFQAASAPVISLDPSEARRQLGAAQEQLQTVWANLDDTVRQSLAEEEGQWVASLDARCREQAAPNLPPEDAQIACRTRLTQERVRYLRGFAIE
ncbi:MAG: lysozyme inhibitor LprI family protein [Neisseria sp.]|nr:lysozyme inhibitor LprI family protein [Neisseria sp.]